MQHDPFNPAQWLARWSAIGGGWVGHHLIRPPGHDPIGANLLAAELDSDRRAALTEYMNEPTERRGVVECQGEKLGHPIAATE